MIYNQIYATSVNNESPRLLGESYPVGYAEIWEAIKPSFDAALAGTTVNAKDDPLYLVRDGILTECYYSKCEMGSKKLSAVNIHLTRGTTQIGVSFLRIPSLAKSLRSSYLILRPPLA